MVCMVYGILLYLIFFFQKRLLFWRAPPHVTVARIVHSITLSTTMYVYVQQALAKSMP